MLDIIVNRQPYEVRKEAWSGARDRLRYLKDEEIETIMEYLEEEYPDGMGETFFNDYWWFDDDNYAKILGFNNFEEIRERGYTYDICD